MTGMKVGPVAARLQGAPSRSERARLRDAVLDAANTIDIALDCERAEATGILLELVERLEEVLDAVAA